MTARTKARKRALDILFAADLRHVGILEVLGERQVSGETPAHEYTDTLVRGVVTEQVRIDSIISEHARDWTLERMPAVDRNLLRLAVWELLHNPDVPDAVVIAEAVALATELSTDESPGFINGVLGAIAGTPRS